MISGIIIDSQTYKIMKYLYGKNFVKFKDIRRKFGDDPAQLVCELCRGNYALIRTPDGHITDKTSVLGDDYEVALIVPGNKYVEDRRSSNITSFVPVFVSIVSAIVSICSLIISLSSSHSEFFVHILK